MKNRILFSILAISILAVIISSSVSAVIVKDLYQKNVQINAANYPLKSCNIQANYESKSCQFLYACYAIIPRYSTTLDEAISKECVDITDTKTTTLQISATLPRGVRWVSTTFIAVLNYTYNTTTYTWDKRADIPMSFRSAEELISLCPTGQMLKKNICYPARSVCLNTFSTNLCDNPYQLYVLDTGYGFRFNDVSSYCADGQNGAGVSDGICDETVSLTCADTNANGVCDVDDVKVNGASCIDANHNYVCDSVEGNGTFCRTNFNPVHCGSNLSCVTYPNECFAKASGCTNPINDTCSPVYQNLCYVDADCTSPCSGVTGLCRNPDNKGNRCYYAGECNPRVIQCGKDSDCPQPFCTGVAAQCTIGNTCTYLGKCITQPISQPAGFWDLIKSIWYKVVQWIGGLFG